MQYVGARYVPKFMGLYDATQAYEGLCVVDNGMGTSYITKVPTPAGTPLTDTDYYAVYGASSGAIINLQNQIGDLNDLTTADQDSLVDAINEVVTDTQALNNKIDINRAIVISDSYGMGRGGQTPWTNPFRVYMGLSSADYFAYSEGSLGFNRAGENGHTALTLLQLHENDVTNPETIDLVVFGLGLNDTLALSGLETAIKDCCDYVKTQYPNAKILIGFIGNFYTKDNSTLNQYVTALNVYQSEAGRNTAGYIHGVENVMHNNMFFIADGIHPTTAGGDAIAKYIAASIKGGSGYSIKVDSTITSSVITSTSSIKMSIDNDSVGVYLYVPGAQNNITFTALTAVDLGEIDDKLLVGISGLIHYGFCFVGGGGSFHTGLWYILNGHIYILPFDSFTHSTTDRMFFGTISYPTIES